MKVMVLVKATQSSESGAMPSERLLAEMGKFNQDLVAAGIMKAGDGLKPSSQGVRVHFSGDNRTLTDGPFAETKELLAGYWLWEVQSMQEAVEWVRRCPNPMPEDSEIEIRPIYEFEDFSKSDPRGAHASHETQLRNRLTIQRATMSPYLFFGGRCEEALDFYESAIAARTLMKLRFSDSPQPLPEGAIPPGFENKIMHASFKVGQMTLLASDGCEESTKIEGFRLALTVESEAACDHAFNALAKGGTVDMALEPTFWSPRYGQVTDQFGIGWMVMVAGATS